MRYYTHREKTTTGIDMILVGDIIKRKSDGKELGRVTSYKNAVPINFDDCDEILKEIHEEEVEERRQRGSKRLTKYKLYYSLPENATHVAYRGVGAGIVKVDEVEVIGLVEWDEDLIKSEREKAIKKVGWEEGNYMATSYWGE